MICPHCNKPIIRNVDAIVRASIVDLMDKGYSTRDVSQLLGGKVSFSTVSRIWKAEKKKNEDKPA